MRWLDGFLETADRSLSKLQAMEKDREAMASCSPGAAKSSV